MGPARGPPGRSSCRKPLARGPNKLFAGGPKIIATPLCLTSEYIIYHVIYSMNKLVWLSSKLFWYSILDEENIFQFTLTTSSKGDSIHMVQIVNPVVAWHTVKDCVIVQILGLRIGSLSGAPKCEQAVRLITGLMLIFSVTSTHAMLWPNCNCGGKIWSGLTVCRYLLSH